MLLVSRNLSVWTVLGRCAFQSLQQVGLSRMKLFLIAMLFAFLAGCATTNLTSFVDPEYQERTYRTLTVVTPGLNLE